MALVTVTNQCRADFLFEKPNATRGARFVGNGDSDKQKGDNHTECPQGVNWFYGHPHHGALPQGDFKET